MPSVLDDTHRKAEGSAAVSTYAPLESETQACCLQILLNEKSAPYTWRKQYACTRCLVRTESLSKLAVSTSEPCTFDSGNRTCSSPVPCKLVNRTFEGIVLLPEALVSPDTMSNSRPLTRKRRAETSPVIDQPGVLHMQTLLSRPTPVDASP